MGRGRPKNVLGRSRPKKNYYTLLGQTRPRRLGWARINLAQQQNGRGELFSPRFCMQNAIRSACRGKEEIKKRKNEGEEGLPGAEEVVALSLLAVLWRRLVAAPGLTDGGSRQRQRCSVFFSVFP